MAQNVPKLDYRTPDASPQTGQGLSLGCLWVSLAVACVAVVTGAGLLWVLQVAKSEPYRPPDDMTPFLTSSERAFVAGIQLVIAGGLLGCAWWIRRGSKEIRVRSGTPSERIG